jgi:very-short-patch-repair endonuclease
MMPNRSEDKSPPPLRGRARVGGKRPLTTRARSLRSSATIAERQLWKVLRRHQLGGFQFRRQQPIGPYVVDFFCASAKLVIEIDGGQHADPSAEMRDQRRTRWLRSHGYRVLRFWNNEVLQNMEGVWQIISDAVPMSDPPPRPSPSRGEGEADGPSSQPSVRTVTEKTWTPLPSPPPQGGRENLERCLSAPT